MLLPTCAKLAACSFSLSQVRASGLVTSTNTGVAGGNSKWVYDCICANCSDHHLHALYSQLFSRKNQSEFTLLGSTNRSKCCCVPVGFACLAEPPQHSLPCFAGISSLPPGKFSRLVVHLSTVRLLCQKAVSYGIASCNFKAEIQSPGQ